MLLGRSTAIQGKGMVSLAIDAEATACIRHNARTLCEDTLTRHTSGCRTTSQQAGSACAGYKGENSRADPGTSKNHVERGSVQLRGSQAADNRQQTTATTTPTTTTTTRTRSSQLTALSSQLTAHSSQPTAHSQQLTANSQQPTANSNEQPTTTNNQPPTTNNQQPTANSQQPTANSQPTNQLTN